MVIHSTFLSFQWNSWLSETVSNCLLSHFTPSFLEDHRSFKNWCSGQLFILVYRSGDLTKNQGLVVCLQWPEITYKTITFGITRCFLKTLPAEEWTETYILMIILIFFILYWQYFKCTNDYKGYKFNSFFKTSIHFPSPLNKIVQGICKPCPSPKLTLFPVTGILAVFIGLAHRK